MVPTVPVYTRLSPTIFAIIFWNLKTYSYSQLATLLKKRDCSTGVFLPCLCSFSEKEEAVVRRCSSKSVFLKIRKFHRQTPVLKFFYNQGFSCKICKIFNNTFTNRTPLADASEKAILQFFFEHHFWMAILLSLSKFLALPLVSLHLIQIHNLLTAMDIVLTSFLSTFAVLRDIIISMKAFQIFVQQIVITLCPK